MRAAFALAVVALMASSALAASVHFNAELRRVNNPTITGAITGRIVYDKPNNRIRNNYDNFGTLTVTEVFDYTNAGGNGNPLRYVSCGTQCTAETWPYEIPDLDPQVASGYTNAGTESVTVTTKSGSQTFSATKWNAPTTQNQVTSVWIANNFAVKVLMTNGEEWHMRAHQAGGDSSIPASWNCPVQKCGIKMDIVVVVDESGSVSTSTPQGGKSEWTLVREFVTALFSMYEWGPEKTQFGVIFFSTNVDTSSVPMFYDQGTTQQLFNARANSKVSGWTNINGMLQAVRNCLAKNSNCGWASTATGNLIRPASQATKVVVIITDGQSCTGSGGGSGCASDNSCNSCQRLSDIQNNAAAIHNTGAYVFSISVCVNAADCSQQELQSLSSNIAGKQTDFSVNSFGALAGIVDSLVTVVCDPFDLNPCGDLCGGFCACGACVCPNDCSDGDLCTDDLGCDTTSTNKICKWAPKAVSDNDGCTDDTCDSATGTITHTQRTIAGCTVGQVSGCGTWVCVGKDSVTGNEIQPFCQIQKNQGQCNDGKFCTDDLCKWNQTANQATCSFPPVAFQCSNCENFDPTDASHLNGASAQCTAVSCNPADGTAVLITGDNSCINVKLVINNVLSEWTPCTPGVCTTTNYIPGTTTLCTKPEECCRFPPMNCDTDGNPCTDDFCNATVTTTVNPADGFSAEVGTCQVRPLDCNDDDACTDDTCVDTVGCRHTLSSTACDNTGGDICTPNTCFNVNANAGTQNAPNWTAVCQRRPIDCTQAPQLKGKSDLCRSAICLPEKGGCVLQAVAGSKIDQCGNCNPPGEKEKACIVGLEAEEAAAIGAGILAVIIIAVIAFILLAGLGGAGAYKVLNKYRGGMQGAQSNPLFEDNGMQGESKLYDDAS